MSSPLRRLSSWITVPWYSSGTSMTSCSMRLEQAGRCASRWVITSGLRDAELHALAAHLLDQDGEVQLAAARDLDAVGPPQVFDAQRDVDAQLALEAVLDLAQGHGAAVLAGERAVVDQEEHADRRLLDLERRQGDGGRVELGRGQRVADGDLVGAGEPDDVAGGDLLDLAVLEAARDPQMGDARGSRCRRPPSRVVAAVAASLERGASSMRAQLVARPRGGPAARGRSRCGRCSRSRPAC